jgi:hypothetical protein
MFTEIEYKEPTTYDEIMRKEVVEFERLWDMAGYIPTDKLSAEGMAKSFFLAGCNYKTELINEIESPASLTVKAPF